MSDVEEKFDVTIKGQISGFNIATTHRVLKLENELQKYGKELNTVLSKLNEQKKLLEMMNARLNNLESFLSSYARARTSG